MIQDFFQLAFKNLKNRGLRSYLTILGIFIGILAVVSLISVGDGLKTAVNSQFGISSTEVMTIQAGGLNAYGPPGSGAVKKLTIKDLEEIKKVFNVKRAVRRNIPSGKLEFNDKVVFGVAASIPEGEDRKFVYEQMELEVEHGRLLEDKDTTKILLGYNFYADKVGLDKSVKIGDKILVQDKKFEVVGIVEKKGSFIVDNAVFMNEEPLLNLMNIGDEIDLIVVQVKDKSLMNKTKEEIEKALRKSRGVKKGEEDFEVSTPEAMLDTVNQILTGVQVFVLMIALISIFVGSIGIVNTMTTSVFERRREIGVMKSVGARNSHIFLLFFIESGLLGLIGGILGIIFGILIGALGTAAISSFIGSTTTLNINFSLIFSALFGSFFIGSVSGIAPALNAAKQNPVDALRS